MRSISHLSFFAAFVWILSVPASAGPQEDFDKAMDLQKNDSLVEANELLRSAAEQGHVDAQVELGRMHANGMGVPKSYLKAHVWYDIAVINGSAPGVFGRRYAFKQLSEAELAEAKELARMCIDSDYQDCD